MKIRRAFRLFVYMRSPVSLSLPWDTCVRASVPTELTLGHLRQRTNLSAVRRSVCALEQIIRQQAKEGLQGARAVHIP